MNNDFTIKINDKVFICSEFHDILQFRPGIFIFEEQNKNKVKEMYDIEIPRSKDTLLFELKVKTFIKENFDI